MDDGLYKVRFETPRGSGTGVVVLQDGHLRGGDSSMFYTGTYTLHDGAFSARILTNVHTVAPHKPSIFGRDIVHITLKGTFSRDFAEVTGVAKEVPDIGFKAELTKLSG
jgi:hypothetical protein